MASVRIAGPLATMAGEAAGRIGLRSKEALAACKADRGGSGRIKATHPGGGPGEVVDAVAGKLGASLPRCRELTREARREGASAAGPAHRARADQAYIDLAPGVVEMRHSGHTPRRIADALNAEGRTTRRGAPRDTVRVQGVLGRIRAAQVTAWIALPPTDKVVVMNDGPEETLRRCEERLRRAEGRLRLMEESVKDYAILHTDTEGVVTSWSQGAERVFGYAEAEILGRPSDVLFTPEDREAGVPRRELAQAETTGHGEDVRWHLRKDGAPAFLNGVVTPLRDEEGGLRGFARVARDVTDRRRAEDKLREGEGRHRAILEGITDAFFALGRDWRFTYVNRKAEGLLGRTRGDLLGKHLWEEYAPALGTEFERSYRRAMDEGATVTFEASYPPRDRWYEVHAYPSPDGLSVYFRDVTERKRAEQDHARLTLASEQQRRIYETALSSTPDFNYVFDLDGRFTYANASLLAVWRKGPDEVLGRDFFDLGYSPEEAALHRREIREVIHTKRPLRAETPFTSHLGEGQYEYIFMPVLGAGGAVVAVVGSTRDITERRRNEEELRGSRQFLASSIDALAAHIAVLDEDGVILMVNGAWRRFATGNAYSPGDCGVGTNYLAACDGDGDDHCQGRRAAAGIRGVLGGRSESFEMEYPCHGPDERRWFLMRATRFESAGSVRAVIAHENITERKRAEEQLQAAKDEAERANRAKDHFLAVLSHELRTPLNPILLAASSMLERTPDPEEVRPTLEMIRQNVKLQARLIDDLLDVMRIVQGKMPLHWGVSDCHALIEQSIEICRSEFQGKAQEVVLDLSAGHHHVNADSARLHQVLWNLVRNAVKFTPEGGTIAVRTRNEDNGEGQIVIEVADTGIGIEPDVLPTIWDPFQQGETTITRRFGGLGLGLAICKGVVDAHGGTLAVESEGLGLGTTFRVLLRTMTEPAIEAEGGGGEARSLPPLIRLNILLVEDEVATLRLMARLLKGLGHRVTATGTVADAWGAFQAGDFDMIVSDIGLPDGTGLDLMRKVKGLRRVPAIALTGYGMDEDVRRSREAGFTTHMTKPIDFTKLEAMIRQVAN